MGQYQFSCLNLCPWQRYCPLIRGSKCIKTIEKPNTWDLEKCSLQRGLLYYVPNLEGPLSEGLLLQRQKPILGPPRLGRKEGDENPTFFWQSICHADQLIPPSSSQKHSRTYFVELRNRPPKSWIFLIIFLLSLLTSLAYQLKQLLSYSMHNIAFIVVAPFYPFVCKMTRAAVLTSYGSAKFYHF